MWIRFLCGTSYVTDDRHCADVPDDEAERFIAKGLAEVADAPEDAEEVLEEPVEQPVEQPVDQAEHPVEQPVDQAEHPVEQQAARKKRGH
ncbi:MAG: hypothetical protein GHCLOJNM_01576 [bacterium]|nr:hypothetical protein [bacterium]